MIQELLNKLDKSLNSSSLWLCFEEENVANYTISDFLLEKLKSGKFHQALVQSDCERGFENYVELLIENDVLKRKVFSGTTYNGERNLVINAISEADARQYLIDLLTGNGKYFSNKNRGKLISLEEAEILTNHFFRFFEPSKEKVLFYQVSPNFLWKVNEIDESLAQLGFFEGHHKDFVLIIQNTKKQKINLHILLTNGFG